MNIRNKKQQSVKKHAKLNKFYNMYFSLMMTVIILKFLLLLCQEDNTTHLCMFSQRLNQFMLQKSNQGVIFPLLKGKFICHFDIFEIMLMSMLCNFVLTFLYLEIIFHKPFKNAQVDRVYMYYCKSITCKYTLHVIDLHLNIPY